MPNQLDITSGQEQATQRHDLYGVVYLLSGTLSGRGLGIADAPFYLGTANVTAPLGAAGADVSFEAYLSPPAGVHRAMSFDPRTGPTTPAIRVPVYNLAFAHAQTLLAAITDNDFSWENTKATLRVGYLKPGQSPDDLAAEDWTPLVLDGFFGAPQDVQLDGFNVVLYSRGASRNQNLSQAVVVGPAQPGTASAGIDKKDIGRPLPIVVGRPDTWYNPPTASIGVRGHTVSGYDAGDTVIQVSPMVSGAHMMMTGGGVNTTRVHIHHRTPVYSLTSGFSDVTYDADKDLLTFVLASGLAADVPRGAYVQEETPLGYRWYVSAFTKYGAITDKEKLEGYIGWRFADGRIVAADLDRWPFEITGAGLLELPRGDQADPNVPVFFEPNDPNLTEVTVQPEFTATVQLTAKMNYGTGATGGTNPTNAIDGNQNTGASLGVGQILLVTFPSAPSPFANDDTTYSVIHLVKGTGVLTLTDSTGSDTFVAATASAAGTYRYVLGSAKDFNATIRILENGSGGTIHEVWWEHDATTQETATRTQDTAVGTGVSGEVGEVMEFAEVVFRSLKRLENDVLLTKVYDAGGSLVDNPWKETENTGAGFAQPKASPVVVMAGLQSFLLGAEGRLDSIAQDTYTTAFDKLEDDGIRWNFVLLDHIRSWTQLEQELAAQTRLHMFYGPSGHEIIYQEATSGFEAAPLRQEFRLEGVPGANAKGGNGPLLERTPVSEIRNLVLADYSPDALNNGEPQNTVEKSNADSVALFGERADPRGRFDFWAHSPDVGNPNYDADAAVDGIAQFMADRYAFAQTRFRFRSAWRAHGIDRGSVVLVAYKVGDSLFRNVRCEVEDINTVPTDSEQTDLVCRSVSEPQRGYGVTLTWRDVFISQGDTWADRIIGTSDRWEQYWSH